MQTLRGVGSRPARMTFSPDGSRVATTSNDTAAGDKGQIVVWDLDE